MHLDSSAKEIVVFRVRFCRKAVTVVGGWHDDFDQSTLVDHAAGKELIGAVSQRGNARDAGTVVGQRLP
ncbi:MAG: hypothetical protein ACRDR6_23920 [Pseudonocardiaceae bacterium]